MPIRATHATLIAAAAALAVTTLHAIPQAGAQAGTRTVYVTALGDRDAPVLDMVPADFTIKEDGKTREIVSAALATTPMQVVLMLDDSGLGLGGIRQGAGQFVETLQNKAEFAIITMGANNRVLVDFTTDPRVAYAGLEKMLARNSPPVFLLDGMFESAQALKRRNAPRPVLVLVSSEGEELSKTEAEDVLGAVQQIGARFYYIGLGTPVTQGTRQPLDANRAAQSTDYESAKRNAVLGSAPKNSGGRSEQILQASGIPTMMKAFATELANQYAITYTTDAPEAKFSVETKRRGVKFRAPARVGSK